MGKGRVGGREAKRGREEKRKEGEREELNGRPGLAGY